MKLPALPFFDGVGKVKIWSLFSGYKEQRAKLSETRINTGSQPEETKAKNPRQVLGFLSAAKENGRKGGRPPGEQKPKASTEAEAVEPGPAGNPREDGRKGGRSRSERKAAAVRENGTKGGRRHVGELEAPLLSCGMSARHGRCDCEEEWGKVLKCGREWCYECGREDSPIHLRRYARLIERGRQMEVIGYFVIEWPLAGRPALRSQGELKRAEKTIKEVLKPSFPRGLTRWHFFGEPRCPGGCPPEKGSQPVARAAGEYVCPACGKCFKLPDCSSLMPYNPHLNVIVDGLYREDLEDIKRELREAFDCSNCGARAGEPCGCPPGKRLIVTYRYRKSVPKKLHTLRYIARPTFLAWQWDEELALELKGFRTTSWWGYGKWNLPPVWSLERSDGKTAELVSLEKGECPDCGSPIQWGGLRRRAWYLAHGYEIEERPAGYVRLSRKEDPSRAGPWIPWKRAREPGEEG